MPRHTKKERAKTSPRTRALNKRISKSKTKRESIDNQMDAIFLDRPARKIVTPTNKATRARVARQSPRKNAKGKSIPAPKKSTPKPVFNRADRAFIGAKKIARGVKKAVSTVRRVRKARKRKR